MSRENSTQPIYRVIATCDVGGERAMFPVEMYMTNFTDDMSRYERVENFLDEVVADEALRFPKGFSMSVLRSARERKQALNSLTEKTYSAEKHGIDVAFI